MSTNVVPMFLSSQMIYYICDIYARVHGTSTHPRGEEGASFPFEYQLGYQGGSLSVVPVVVDVREMVENVVVPDTYGNHRNAFDDVKLVAFSTCMRNTDVGEAQVVLPDRRVRVSFVSDTSSLTDYE